MACASPLIRHVDRSATPIKRRITARHTPESWGYPIARPPGSLNWFVEMPLSPVPTAGSGPEGHILAPPRTRTAKRASRATPLPGSAVHSGLRSVWGVWPCPQGCRRTGATASTIVADGYCYPPSATIVRLSRALRTRTLELADWDQRTVRAFGPRGLWVCGFLD